MRKHFDINIWQENTDTQVAISNDYVTARIMWDAQGLIGIAFEEGGKRRAFVDGTHDAITDYDCTPERTIEMVQDDVIVESFPWSSSLGHIINGILEYGIDL